MLSLPGKQPARKNHHKVLVIILVVLIILGTAGFFVWSRLPTPQASPSDTAGNNKDSKQDIADKPTPNTSDPDDIPTPQSLGVAITQLERKEGAVVITGIVTGASEGTCVVEFTTPEDRPVVREVAAVKGTQNTTCGPITVNEVEFSYLGTWQARITFYTPGAAQRAQSDSKTIDMK